MEKDRIDFSKLDEELDDILYNINYKPILELWKEQSKHNLDFIWHWFLREYDHIYPGGIFDENHKMKIEAKRNIMSGLIITYRKLMRS